MKKCSWMSKMTCCWLLLAAAVGGCINVDYVGQTLPSLPAGTPVVLYTPESPMPKGLYRSIGRVTVTAPQRSTTDELRTVLTELAEEHGAEAVNVVEFKRINVGVEAYGPEGGQPSWNKDNRNAGGGYIYSNSFGQRASLPENTHPVVELRLKALLMVTNERFAEMQALYRKEHAQFEPKNIPSSGEEMSAAQALDKSAGNAALPPPQEVKTVPEKQSDPRPINVELSDDRRQPVAL